MRIVREIEHDQILMGVAYALLILACVLMLAGCGAEPKAPEKQPSPVRVATVEANGDGVRSRYSASIEPFEQLTLAFKASGYVREIKQVRGTDGKWRNLQEGDEVGEGTILARVQDSDYAARRNQAKASLAEAVAGLDRAKLDWQRADRLFQSQSLTKPDYDAARAGFEAGQARVEAAQAKLAEAEVSLGDTVVKAPSSGLVLKREVEVGSLVAPGSPGFVIAKTRSVKAVFGVPDWLVGYARLGMVLPVRIESLASQEFKGHISSISPIANSASRLFEVELTLDNPRGVLKPGLIATVEVPEADASAAQARATALVVPLPAILRSSDGKFEVVVVESSGTNSVARRKKVEVGEIYGNRVAVRSGLTRGERVVVSGASLLAEGEAVRVIE